MKRGDMQRFKQGTLVVVEWHDIVSDHVATEPALAENCGWVYSQNAERIVLCNGRYIDKRFNDAEHSETTAIPCGCIKSIRRVKG